MPAQQPPSPDTASDAELLAAIAGRDKTAFAALFDRYAGRIKGFMMRSGASAQDADEIVQDVMVSIWRRAASFDPSRAGAATWIFAIARNRRIDLIRRARRPVPDPEDPLFQPDPEPDGLDTLAQAEQEARVRAGLATLAPEQRAVLVAAFYDGLSQSEIALAQNLPLGTVKSRFRLAFRHLRGVLGEDLAPETDNG
jgi:RNA polymerase sigma-70 factor (ECF subfamily)